MPRASEGAHVPDINIKDPQTKKVVRRLATLKKMSITDTVKLAVEHELQREMMKEPLFLRLSALRARYRAMPDTGLPVDKAFYDSLSGDL